MNFKAFRGLETHDTAEGQAELRRRANELVAGIVLPNVPVLSSEALAAKFDPLFASSMFVDAIADAIAPVRGDFIGCDPGVETTKPTWTVDTANDKAMELAKSDPQFARDPSPTRWGKAIGCSKGLVAKLAFYKSCREKFAKPKNPRAVTLSPKVEAATGRDDAELQRLIDESAPDDLSPAARANRKRAHPTNAYLALCSASSLSPKNSGSR